MYGAGFKPALLFYANLGLDWTLQDRLNVAGGDPATWYLVICR